MKYLKMAGNALLYFAIYFLAQMISGLAVGVWIAIKLIAKYGPIEYTKHVNEAISKYTFIIVVAGAVIAFIIFILMFKNKEENLFKRCRFDKIDRGAIANIIIAAIGISFLCGSFIAITQNIFKDYSQVSNQISSGEQSILGIICAVIIIPFFEEILFRGLIFNELRKNLNIIASVIIQALIFAVAHGNIAQGIYTFFLGTVAALVYIWTKSILANITLHITFNLFGSIVLPVMSSFIETYIKGNAMGEYIVLGSYTIIGIALIVIALKALYKKQEINEVESQQAI